MILKLLKSQFIIIYFISIFSYCQPLELYGRSVRFITLEEKLNGLCQYIKNVDETLNQTENNGNTFKVAWAYGYLTALLSQENDKLRSLINAYNGGQLNESHAQQFFQCINKFFSKLTLSSYIQNQNNISRKFKIEYLPAADDIRIIAESGLAFSFYLYEQKKPNSIRDRFLVLYDKRENISNPVNKIFDILYPKRNSSMENDFLFQISSWIQCDKSYQKLSEMLIFLNSLQRYLISGMFVEEFYLLLKFKDRSEMESLRKYLLQLESHRGQYKTISQIFTEIYSQCYVSLKNKLDYDVYKNKNHAEILISKLRIYETMIFLIFLNFLQSM